MKSFLQEIILKKEIDVSNSLIIFSDPRGGSTWLMEMIYFITSSVINWEPLHQNHGVIPTGYRWGDRPYIHESDDNREYLNLITDILSLKRYSEWTLKYFNLKDFDSCQHILTKFVRANLLLPWITKKINLRHKPIYLLRHPIAVAMSQIEAFQNSSEVLKKFSAPDWINNERFIEHEFFLNKLDSRLERQVALWLINNNNTINHPESGKRWQVIFYEDLVINPKNELISIMQTLNLDFNHELLDSLQYREASLTNFTNSFIQDPREQLGKWQLRLNNTQLQGLQEIFNYFNFKTYTAFNILPEKN